MGCAMCVLQAEVLSLKQQLDALQVQADANSGSWKAKYKQLEGNGTRERDVAQLHACTSRQA